MSYCQDILLQAQALTGFQHEGLRALAERVDARPDLVAALQLFDVSSNEASPPMDELESLLGKDYRGFFVLSILRLLPQARAIYQGLGLPDALFRFTMADIPLNMQVYQRIHGCLGLSEGQLSWLQLHLAGELFRLGRLQFMRRCLEEDSRLGELSLPKGMALLDVHIPADGPLDRAACLDSYRQALPFFRHIFGFEAQGFICNSWLLAEELTDLLSPTANILTFQRDYAVSDKRTPDESVYNYVFQREKPIDLGQLPADSSLRASMKRFLMDGGHIHARQGFRPPMEEDRA